MRLPLFSSILILATGCASVDPAPEFERARELLAESTGQAGAPVPFDPMAPTPTAEQIAAFLSDGLELEEALGLALRNDPRIRAAFMEIGVATADWVQSGLLTNPSLHLFFRFPSGGGSNGVEASLAQELLDLWKVPVREQVARQHLDSTVLEIAGRAVAMHLEVRSAYFEAVAALEMQGTLEQNRELLGTSFQGIQTRVNAGSATRLDESLFRGKLLSGDQLLRDARLASADALRRLARVVGIEASLAGLQLSTPLPRPEQTALDPEALVRQALAARLDLRALAARIEEAQYQEALQIRERFPALSLGVGVERAEKPKGALEREPTVYGPSISTTLPIFDQNQAGVARARYLRHKAEHELAALRVSVAQSVRQASDHLTTAVADVALYRDALIPNAEQSLQYAERLFSSGQISILSLIDAQRRHLEVRSAEVRSRLSAARALADLEVSIGSALGAGEQDAP